MTAAELGNLRLASQRVGAGQFKKPAETVAHLGAMQAQDFAMARIAVGLRTTATTEAEVLAAYNKGEIIRTHALRPTWHLMANADVDWMLRLSAPQIRDLMPGRQKQLGLSETVFKKSNGVIEKTVAAGPALRDELIAALKKAKITGIPEIYSHILFRAELDRLICSGPMKGIHPTYAAYADRIKKSPLLKREDALVRLAERYFLSHGPATLADFTWWSGLRVGDARAAYAAVEKQFSREKLGEVTYLIPKSLKAAPAEIHLLPAFDEFLIAYSDRGAVTPKSISPRVMSVNGIFWPIIVANGQVRGRWKREIKKDKFTFRPEYFGKADTKLKGGVEKRAAALREFLGIGA